MKTNAFNTAIFKLKEFKSHTPNILGSIIHPVQEEGTYSGELYIAGQLFRRILITCTNDASDTQLNIDFTEHHAASRSKDNGIPEYRLKTEGYIVLYTSMELADFNFKLHQKVQEKSKSVFYSKALGPGDIYAVSLLEPGTYAAQNTAAKSKMKIVVKLPDTKKSMPLPTPEPVTIKVSANGFSEKEINIISTQGIVFALETKTDVLINFEDSNDKKEDKSLKDTKHFRWNNPNFAPKRSGT
ncbi:hypothetical protein [Flavobacterium sp. LC2016-01]|uniref:hypothetical protein n=1 Tax=Flavobacterium sp. LC2016-01 TaxID=2675876 RepID=UPI0012BB1765|nr:hypothetical protein [Flavobacterium sp. LC2016-01]MTH15798.1 hypothetical protein [Flavobacterium sp. LC2016-01]